MSRIGRKPIAIPAGVEVAVNGNEVTVKGPKGTMTQTFNSDLTVTVENGEVLVTRPSDDKEHRSLHGLTRTLIANMVHGVSEGFTKELEIQGVGYRAVKQGKDLVMTLASPIRLSCLRATASPLMFPPRARSSSAVTTSRP